MLIFIRFRVWIKEERSNEYVKKEPFKFINEDVRMKIYRVNLYQ